MNSRLLEKLPNSPAGAQMRWYLECLMSEGEGATARDRARYTPELRRRIYGVSEPEDERSRWGWFINRSGQVVELTIDTASEFSIAASLATAKGHKWKFFFEVRRVHRI